MRDTLWPVITELHYLLSLRGCSYANERRERLNLINREREKMRSVVEELFSSCIPKIEEYHRRENSRDAAGERQQRERDRENE